MSQEELADITGIAKSHISEYINNKRQMSFITAHTISTVLGLKSSDELYEWIRRK